MRRLAPILLATCALMGSPSLVPEVRAGVARLQRLAVVDVQRCILETREGKRARKDLEKTFAKSQARIERKGKELQKKAADLQAKAAMLEQSRLVARQDELMRADMELQELQQQLQNDIMEKEALLTEKIYKKVAAIVHQIALEEVLQLVLVRNEMSVLFSNPQLDLTNRVIVAYDKKYK